MEDLIKLLDTDDFSEFRKIQIALIREFKKICEVCQIRYYAAFGTLLGVIRHSGYIPWDDDVDFWIWREDLPKLKAYAIENELQNRFVFEDDDEEFTCGVIRYLDPETTYIDFNCFSEKGMYGINIDIECLDYTFVDEGDRHKKNETLDLFYEVGMYKKHELNHWYIKTLDQEKRSLVIEKSGMMDYKTLLTSLDFEVKKSDSTKYCSAYTYHQYPVMLSEWFEETIIMPFEDINLPVPSKWQPILNAIYSNTYAILPPKQDRVPKHLYGKYFNPNVPYDITLRDLKNFWKVGDDKIYIVWGTGNMSKYYVDTFCWSRIPDFFVDNDPEKWGKYHFGSKVISPKELFEFDSSIVHLVICNIYYPEIIRQIKETTKHHPFIFLESYVKKNENEIRGMQRQWLKKEM